MSNGKSKLQCGYGTKLGFIANKNIQKFVNLQKNHLPLPKMLNRIVYKCLNQ